ncbi:dihydrodipicolinate reductase [Thiobacillus denitrificans ATCC 25259]|uniref:4-hydroxy-tetrahydrodipicolinate reductase n=1 Tax=Thiobacillus denitrificans (strain ATCC 25259 / T1) TaxID=292415 RepID=DAPB_THIDA|nr:4-hydroxy-tetrahydrodipicolinate reductase [Thiobacillus denitrificans]Q3SJS2.1 RecName: Full=4-hydroxy-tetrahydrodipicolinate reductase; Short=HTPA reductase [Thiobacillus denitrificans ATCC 25259]AAZ97078.1 dihydrodipicolinate reductase [Thiobacillus denitrificans ATCC 25259]
MSVRVAIAGVSGRMGRALLEAVAADDGCALYAALDRPGSSLVGQDAGAAWGAANGVTVTDQAQAALKGAQVLVDFTRPEATFGYLEACALDGVPVVIGTTGFDEAGRARIAAAAERVPVVFAPNMSVGVNLLMKLAEVAAEVLQDGYDIEIIEAHHRHKVDAPSGTALGLGQAVARASGRDLEACAVYGREGVTGERDPRTIGFATVRGGDIVGDHTLLFAGVGERVELTHKASSRATFAQGALRAAKWVQGRAPGLYDMRDVLGLK